MFEWNAEGGLLALFVAAFLSATVLPANSEVVLLAVLMATPERAALAIAVATVGNTLGGLTTYGIGRLLPARGEPQGRALAWVRRHGAVSLLFSWVPIIGDALCAAAGWMRVPLAASLLAMTLGKLARYWLVAQAASLL